MESILSSADSPGQSSKSSTQIKAASAPIMPVESDTGEVKKQISAPSYFHSLKENDAPPFKKPTGEPVPMLLIGTILNEADVIEMIAAGDTDPENGLKKFIGQILVEKNIIRNHDLSEKKFLISLMRETINYAAQRDFDARKLSVLLTIYLDSHRYFKWYYWQSPINVWNYFKEIMIRHTIEDSPEGQEIFEPEECYDVITHFHTIYLSNLPLIHILTFGAYRLKFMWPYKAK